MYFRNYDRCMNPRPINTRTGPPPGHDKALTSYDALWKSNGGASASAVYLSSRKMSSGALGCSAYLLEVYNAAVYLSKRNLSVYA